MAEIAIDASADVSPNAGAMVLVLTVTPGAAASDTVVVPANRMSAIAAAILINSAHGGIPKACTWVDRTVTLTGVGAGGTGDEHTLIVIGA